MNTCYNPFTLEGKTILVTGASSGIGKATAIECSKLGAKIILNGRDEKKLNDVFDALEGNGHKIVKADLSTEDGLQKIINAVSDLDGVVLSAGISKMLPVQFAIKEKMQEIFDVNFFAASELMATIYKKKKINKGGSFVLIDSVAGVYNYSFGNSMYGASKAALNAFAKYASNEFVQRQIRVNCICPGMIETPLIHSGTISDKDLDEDKRHYLGKRYGFPEEIAYGVIYLLSDASQWVTGTNLVIDGGISS